MSDISVIQIGELAVLYYLLGSVTAIGFMSMGAPIIVAVGLSLGMAALVFIGFMV